MQFTIQRRVGAPRRRGSQWLALAAGLLIAMSYFAGPQAVRAASYIGADLKDVKPEDRVTVAHPQPVQILFEFQTKGAPNARGTKLLKAQVMDTVRASGLFSEVDETPAPNGALLNIVINNVAKPQDMTSAEAKGAVTGATLFIAGSTVADHYEATVDYIASPAAAKITKTAQQVVLFQMGLINKPPENAVKIGNITEAVMAMTKQVVANPLNALAADPGFQPQTAPPATATASAAQSPSSPATTPATPATPAAPPTPAVPAAASAPAATPPATAPASTSGVAP
ncbi:MAG TPA: hypothetical protein VHY34_10640 [Caulobacteraceae bacterium]|jgi:hypothetical protein|nr:hypothetical protein [Caulobacteraceae bacterium]